MNHGLTVKLAWCVDEAYQKKMILDMKRYEFQKHEFSQMLDGVRIMPEEFENESFTVRVWFVFELNTGREPYCFPRKLYFQIVLCRDWPVKVPFFWIRFRSKYRIFEIRRVLKGHYMSTSLD